MTMGLTSGVYFKVSILGASFVGPQSGRARECDVRRNMDAWDKLGTSLGNTEHTECGSGEMGGPKFIATCGDQRMSTSLFKRMTVVRGAKRVRTMGRSSVI